MRTDDVNILIDYVIKCQRAGIKTVDTNTLYNELTTEERRNEYYAGTQMMVKGWTASLQLSDMQPMMMESYWMTDNGVSMDGKSTYVHERIALNPINYKATCYLFENCKQQFGKLLYPITMKILYPKSEAVFKEDYNKRIKNEKIVIYYYEKKEDMLKKKGFQDIMGLIDSFQSRQELENQGVYDLVTIANERGSLLAPFKGIYYLREFGNGSNYAIGFGENMNCNAGFSEKRINLTAPIVNEALKKFVVPESETPKYWEIRSQLGTFLCDKLDGAFNEEEMNPREPWWDDNKKPQKLF